MLLLILIALAVPGAHINHERKFYPTTTPSLHHLESNGGMLEAQPRLPVTPGDLNVFEINDKGITFFYGAGLSPRVAIFSLTASSNPFSNLIP